MQAESANMADASAATANYATPAMLQSQTQTFVLGEFDIRKNGRHRRVTLEMHRTPPPETDPDPAFQEKVYLRISKKNVFSFASKWGKQNSSTNHSNFSDDSLSVVSQDSTDYNDYTPTVGSAPSTPHGAGASNSLSAVPESDIDIDIDTNSILDTNSIVSPPRFHASDSTWISRYLLEIKKVEITSMANKRVTLNLRYKTDREPEERHFVFHSEHEAKDFCNIVRHQKDQERHREQYILKSALENAGLENQVRNMEVFEVEQLEFLVEIVGAENLAVEDLTSSDPYVVCQFGDKILHKTQYIPKNLNPVFTLRKNAFFIWSISAKDLFVEGDGLKLVVYDFDFSAGIGERHEVLGGATVPVKDIYNAKEERLSYPLKPITIGNKTRGHDKGKIAVRIRRATEHDKEFLATYEAYRKKKTTTGILTKRDKSKKKERGDEGVSALRSWAETKVRTFIDDDGSKVLKFKTMPRPDPNNKIETEWMSSQEIETAVMGPSRKYDYIGSGKIARVYLEILSCDGLPNMEGAMGKFGNKTDGFVQVVYEDCICKTEVIDDKNNPRFLPWTRRAFVLHTNYPSSVINLGVFDYDPGAALLNDHDLIGRASVDITNLRPGTEYQLNYTLFNTALIDKRKPNLGTIKIRLRVEIDDPKAYLLASLKLPPPIYVNSSTSKDFECVHQTCYGEYNMSTYSLDTIFALVDELSKYQRIYYYICEFMQGLILWRGGLAMSLFGKQFSVPVNSICTFLMAITLVENPRLLPCYSFLTLGFVLLASMGWRNNHPNPWWRCPTFLDLAKILVFADAHLEPETIAENERAEETVRFDNKWKTLIESAEKRSAARAEEVAKEQILLQKELDVVGGVDAQISSNVGGPSISLNPLQMAKKFLFPVQQMLVWVCEWTRFAKNIFLWEESYYSFWLTLVSFALAFVCFFVPWIFIIKWTSRIVAWLLFGPLMKVADVYYFASTSTEVNPEDETKAEDAVRLGRKKVMDKTIADARVRNELAFKLRDFKQYFFGKFLTKVPAIKADRFIDIPLSSSTAKPYEKQLSSAAGGEITAPDRERGQFLKGLMIPVVKEEDEFAAAIVVENDSSSAPIESLKMGGAIGIAATLTYFLVPFLIYAVKSLCNLWK